MPIPGTSLQPALLWIRRLDFSSFPLPSTKLSRTWTFILAAYVIPCQPSYPLFTIFHRKPTLSPQTPKSGLVLSTLILVVVAAPYISSFTTLARPVVKGLTSSTATHSSSGSTLYMIPPNPASVLPKPSTLMPPSTKMELPKFIGSFLEVTQHTDFLKLYGLFLYNLAGLIP